MKRCLYATASTLRCTYAAFPLYFCKDQFLATVLSCERIRLMINWPHQMCALTPSCVVCHCHEKSAAHHDVVQSLLSTVEQLSSYISISLTPRYGTIIAEHCRAGKAYLSITLASQYGTVFAEHSTEGELLLEHHFCRTLPSTDKSGLPCNSFDVAPTSACAAATDIPFRQCWYSKASCFQLF